MARATGWSDLSSYDACILAHNRPVKLEAEIQRYDQRAINPDTIRQDLARNTSSIKKLIVRR